MRGVLLLAMGVLALWAVIQFYPQSVEADAGSTPAPTGREAEIDDGGGGPSQASNPSPATTPSVTEAQPRTRTPESAPANSGREGGSWLDQLGPPREVLGRSIAHGERAGLLREMEEEGYGMEQPLVRLASSFAAAMEGDGREAREIARELNLQAEEIERTHELLLQRALGADGGDLRPAAALARDPLERGMRMALQEAEAVGLARNSEYARAAALYSDLLLAELDAPWAASQPHLQRWADELERMQEGHRWNPRGDWPFAEVRVEPGDGLTDVRLRFLSENEGPPVCTGLIARANRIGNRYLREGEVLRVPTDPVHTRVDLDSRWLLYLHGAEVVAAWSVGIGREGHETRPGNYTVGVKKENPMWFPPGQAPVPFGDPDNPLGTRWIGWDVEGGGPSSLGFHGTNAPEGVGGAVSDGCIRMHDAEVEVLFEVLPMGSPILVAE